MSSGLSPFRFVTAALFASALLAGSIAAQAQPQIRPPQPQPQPQQGPGGPGGPQGPAAQPSSGDSTIKGTTPEITMAALRAAGYQNARIYTSDGGKRHAAGDIHGWTVSAIHANCGEDGTCLTLLYLVNFGAQATIDAAYINAWSARSYYSSMYQNDGKVFLQWGVFAGDSSVKNITRTAQVFAASLKDVLEFKPN